MSQYLGYFCMNICHQQLSKISQSSHTKAEIILQDWSHPGNFFFQKILCNNDDGSQNLGKIVMVYWIFGNSFYLLGLKFYSIGCYFHCCKWPSFKKLSTHLVTMLLDEHQDSGEGLKFNSHDCLEYSASFLYLFLAIFHTQDCLKFYQCGEISPNLVTLLAEQPQQPPNVM